MNFRVELGKGRPSETKGVGGCDEVSWSNEGCRRCESFDACLLIRMLLKFGVELTELFVPAIDRLERNQLDRVGGEIGSVALVFGLGSAVFDFVRGAVEFCNDPPGTGEGICQLVDQSTARVGANCPASKHNITNGEVLWVWTARINKLAVPRMLLLDQKTPNITKCREA